MTRRLGRVRPITIDCEDTYMSKMRSMKLAGLGLLLVGVCAGLAAAQVAQMMQARYLNTGLFTVRGGQTASFHVVLDDRRTGEPAEVALQFLDADGAIVGSSKVTLQAGQSTTLRIDRPGVYRAHAQVIEPSGIFSARRAVAGTVEIFDQFTTETRFVCSIDDSSPGVRPQ